MRSTGLSQFPRTEKSEKRNACTTEFAIFKAKAKLQVRELCLMFCTYFITYFISQLWSAAFYLLLQQCENRYNLLLFPVHVIVVIQLPVSLPIGCCCRASPHSHSSRLVLITASFIARLLPFSFLLLFFFFWIWIDGARRAQHLGHKCYFRRNFQIQVVLDAGAGVEPRQIFVKKEIVLAKSLSFLFPHFSSDGLLRSAVRPDGWRLTAIATTPYPPPFNMANIAFHFGWHTSF